MRITHVVSGLASVCLVVLASVSHYSQDAASADLITKHKASVGTPAALASVKNQLIVSEAQFTFKGSTVVIKGKSLVLSTPERSLFGMEFTSNDYPRDRFGFDGKDVKVARATPNARSLIGDFLDNNQIILREGLLGGALNANWPLFHPKIRGARLKAEGTRTIGGKEMLVFSYDPKNGSDLNVKLFFDPVTSQHLRTEYVLLRAAGQGSDVDNSAGQSGTVYRLVEEFSNFAKMGDLLLPGIHKLTYSRTTTAGTATRQTTNREAEWTFMVTDIGFNRDLDPKSFDVNQK